MWGATHGPTPCNLVSFYSATSPYTLQRLIGINASGQSAMIYLIFWAVLIVESLAANSVNRWLASGGNSGDSSWLRGLFHLLYVLQRLWSRKRGFRSK